MNSSYDFNSKKYIILLVIICVLFFIFTLKIFEYMPSHVVEQADGDISQTQNINSPAHTEQQETAEEEDDSYDEQKHKKGHIDFMPKESDYDTEVELDEVPVPKGAKEDKIVQVPNSETNSNLSDSELALQYIIRGFNYKASKDFTNALTEYQKAAEMAEEDELKAMCYEAIAEIYAHQRRFGTALSFAAKANNISPTVARELLISRIYYQSGNTENAVARMNNLLKRSF